MKLSATSTSPAQIDVDAVVVGLSAEIAPSGAAAEIDQATGGALARLIETKEITGKRLELTSLLAPAGVKAPHVVVVGLGKAGSSERDMAYQSASAAAKLLAGKERKRVAFYLAQGWKDELTETAVCGSLVGCQGQDLYRAEKNRFPFDEILWAGVADPLLERGRILGESVNLTRRLVNEPPQEIYPESFAASAAEMAKSAGLEVEIWDEKRLADERCGSLLAVGRGSDRPSRLVILRYSGGKKGQAPLALVGKGVTFDSGGLSIKPTDGMLTMKCDMAGAATVVGAMQAIARLKLPLNVVGLVGLVENLISGKSYKLGDVLTARSGKTIEVHNTDAEGRLVLADVLNVTLDQKPSRIVDLATLTGACVVALGNDVAGLMTNEQAWCDAVADAARTCGERAWQLPMFEEYGKQIKSEVADIKNVGEGRWGGAITAAKFLEEFVDGTPWVHMDIAGPAFADKAKPWIDAGASGIFVRTLVELARRE